MDKNEFKELILKVNETNPEIVNPVIVPEEIIEILVNDFQVWDDFEGMTYEEIVKDSDETGEFPAIDNTINFYGDMETKELSLGSVLDALFELADDFDMSLKDAAIQHRIVYVKSDDIFVLLY